MPGWHSANATSATFPLFFECNVCHLAVSPIPKVITSSPVLFMLFHTLCDFHRNSTVLNSKVISLTIKPTPSSLATPLEIEFSHLYNVSQPDL